MDMAAFNLSAALQVIHSVTAPKPTSPRYMRADCRSRYLNRLYVCAAQLCALLAHMSCDFNYPEVAATHARTAWLCADLCGHDALRGSHWRPPVIHLK